MKKPYILVFFIFLVFKLYAQSDTTKYGVVIPHGFIARLDIVYDKVNDWEGKMDIYIPPNSGKPTPVVINIHGGGWARNSKEKEGGFQSFFKNNIAVANMSYRLVDTAPAPAAVEDVRSVMIYLVKNAKELNIDPNKIILMGSSAGGHLAMMGGYLNNNTLYDKDKEVLKDIQVAAVINKYGVTDMVDFTVRSMQYKSAVKWIGPHIDDLELIKSVSPHIYINKNTPPTLIIHGDADDVVPYRQSLILQEALEKHNVKYHFITVEGGGHGRFEPAWKNKINQTTIEFLKELTIID